MIDLDRAFLGALRACVLEHDSYLQISTKVPYWPTIKRGSNNDAGTIIHRYLLKIITKVPYHNTPSLWLLVEVTCRT
jgi:hypothetical protein